MVRSRPSRTRTCSFTCTFARKPFSSQIEGTQSSLQDLLAAEAHVLGDGRPRDVDEIVNYVAAMKYGLARLADLPVSVRLIREIHAQLLKGVRGSRLTPGEPVLYLSHHFKRHRQEYYERLQAVRDTGDFEGWLAFFLRGVSEVSVEAADTARRILKLREEHRKAITTHLGRAAGNGHQVLEQLYEQPIMSVNDVRALLKTTFAGANQIVQRLVEHNILVEITGQAMQLLLKRGDPANHPLLPPFAPRPAYAGRGRDSGASPSSS